MPKLPKTEIVNVRFDMTEKATLQAVAAAAGEAVSEFVREAVLSRIQKQTTGEALNDNGTYHAPGSGAATA